MKKRLLGMVCLLLVAADTLADNHWTVNPHAFQYDMTTYVTLAWVEQSDYEVAAFCGEECRGVGKLLTADDGSKVFQLRIRSNEASGETIIFRVYKTSTQEERRIEETVEFETQTMAGTPSEPLVLTLSDVLKGDVNGDGKINEVDAQLILDVSVGNKRLQELPVPEAVSVPGGNDDALEVNAQLVLDYSVAAVKPW